MMIYKDYDMGKFLSKKVVKLTVKDLKEQLKDADDDAEVILCFNLKEDDGVLHGYLAEVIPHLKYDGVLKETLENAEVVELDCYNHKFCTYKEQK